jgi:hypothetical protein
MPQLAKLSSEQVIVTSITKQQIDGMLLTNLFGVEETDKPFASISGGTVQGQSEPTVAIMASLLKNTIDAHRLWIAEFLHGRGRVLRLTLFLFITIAVGTSDFWLFETYTPSKGVEPTWQLLEQTTQASATQTLYTAKAKPAVQATDTANSLTPQPSAQVAVSLTPPPSSHATSIATLGSSPSGQITATRIPSATPISYESESSQNTIAGGAIVMHCYVCSLWRTKGRKD